MITLEVRDFCRECPDFEPTTLKTYSENKVYMTQVTCEHIARCSRAYIKGQDSQREEDSE